MLLGDFERMRVRAGDETVELVAAPRATAADHAFRLRGREAVILVAARSGGVAEVITVAGDRFSWRLDAHDVALLEEEIARGEILVTWCDGAPPLLGSGGRGDEPPHVPGSGPAPGGTPPGEARSFYELVVVDELEAPIAGLRVTMSTPAGTVTKPTDGAGRVRVDGAPPGMGRASVTRVADLASLFAGRERKPRRTARLPEGPSWHVRTARDAGESVTLPDGEPQRLMIVTRTDLRHFVNRRPWTELSVAAEGPWLLDGGAQPELALCADATGAEAVVLCGAAPAEGEALPEGTPEWLRTGIDALHAALFQGDFGPVWALLESIPLDPPIRAVAAPPAVVEQLAFEASMAELVLEGRVDPAADKESAV
ncbi:hypothetical protein [Chondromyces apiculatus]|uniref:Uncharacterized protein n=1 Tax=Chondromyces apiculatus DSM 436 TaxID=1192034 RepID=A0A017SV46_9BACT|nr:hypothetical protein [Chondromyces apiculatus]EYF00475.1 Hypothetical protein CAP_0565 [Chondromyces apiculatus DSM 436]